MHPRPPQVPKHQKKACTPKPEHPWSQGCGASLSSTTGWLHLFVVMPLVGSGVCLKLEAVFFVFGWGVGAKAVADCSSPQGAVYSVVEVATSLTVDDPTKITGNAGALCLCVFASSASGMKALLAHEPDSMVFWVSVQFCPPCPQLNPPLVSQIL